MTRRKFPEVGKCRTCQCPCSGPATDLYRDRFKGQIYAEILRIKLSVELPNLPDASCTICTRCTKLIESIDAFVRQCQQTNDLLEQQVTVPVEPPACKQKAETVDHQPSEKTSSTCYLEMDCDEDDEDFNGFSNDDETRDVPSLKESPSSELVVKLEMNANDSEDEGDHEDDDDAGEEHEEKLFAAEIASPKVPIPRGPKKAWKAEHIKLLLAEGLKHRLHNGTIDHTMVHLALQKYPEIAIHSREGIKAKLHYIKRLVKKPGMPKIKNKVFEREALDLFGEEVKL